MTKLRFTMQTVALSALMLALASLANAQATRTWVSGVGDDVNPCSRTAPCKTWAGAISKTAAGGEIDALDPGGFGTLTITKSITVDGTTGAGWGSTLNSGGINGFVINDSLTATPNTIKVVLRNLSINGAGTTLGLNGISYTSGATVEVENVSITNQSNTGINVNKTAQGQLFVNNVVFDNVNTAIRATTTGGIAFVNVNNAKVHGNSNGVVYTSNAAGSVTNSVFARNIGGADGSVSAGNNCTVNVIGNNFTSNTTAVRANVGSTVRVSGNQIYDNTNGLAGNAASFQSGNDNKLAGNGASLAPTGAAITNQ